MKSPVKFTSVRKLKVKIEAGLHDIRAGRTVALSEYVKQRAKRKARSA